MMTKFEDVTLAWRGVDYTLKAKGIMPVVAQVEDTLRGEGGKQGFQVLLQPGGPSYPRLSMAFGVALRAAGCAVTDEEIYLSITAGFASGEVDAAQTVQSAVFALLSIMSPPMALALQGDDEPGEA